MTKKDLFDFDYTIDLPDQLKVPLNVSELGRTVRDVLERDLALSSNYLIITGFTSLSKLIEAFGDEKYNNLQHVRIAIGYDPDERISKKLHHVPLPAEIKNYWLKQDISILLCGPILYLIDKIENNKVEFRVKNKLHAKIYIGDEAAILGSSNFSKSGTSIQPEANIRATALDSLDQYSEIKKVAEFYYNSAEPYNKEVVALLKKLLRDVTWQEALARAIAEILESKWMQDYPDLYQALVSHELWPSQKIGIARAMKIIQDQGRVLIADPTGSGKTKFATALAYTLFHWLWENGLKDRSNALIIAPKQVVDNWEREQQHFKLYNKIESMGRLSLGHEKNQKALQKTIEASDILVVDEAHNYLHPTSKRSKAINPKGSTHVILSTATPINKKADDLLRLVELLDLDNLSNDDLKDFFLLRKNRTKKFGKEHVEKLRTYISHFIVRRTKRELNKMIDRDPDQYVNRNGKKCRYPTTVSEIYKLNESLKDCAIAKQISGLASGLKGVHYLQNLKFPDFYRDDEERKNYVIQRFHSAAALASYMVRSSLRSSRCALYEYLHGTLAANSEFGIDSPKSHTGNIVKKIENYRNKLPRKNIDDKYLTDEFNWLYDAEKYTAICAEEINIYNRISLLVLQLSSDREKNKAATLVDLAKKHKKVLAFDSTVITLDYLKKEILQLKDGIETIVATGANSKNKEIVKQSFDLGNRDDHSLIALCSDAMSEGINLPDAQALVLLDMPSVLRIIEQRIGRLERMDSEHETIYVYWPEDADEFSLKGDQRLIDILVVTDNLIGNNVEIPKTLYDKYLKENPSVENIIRTYNELSQTDFEWQGVRDNTQCLYDLIDGPDSLINLQTYNEFKDVDATTKTAVSIVENDKQWAFFAFRGSTTRSPKWMLIDEKDVAITDFADITEKLKSYLDAEKIVQRSWKEVDINQHTKTIVGRLRRKEKELLPWKKRRALEVSEKILKDLSKVFPEQSKIRTLISYYDVEHENSFIDIDHFAGLWLTILIPQLDLLKDQRQRKRTILTLKDLNYKNVTLTEDNINWLLENCQFTSSLDETIASCIIGIKHSR